jgi:hypothetical protein
MAFGEIEDEAGFLRLIGEEVHRQFSEGAVEVWMHRAVTAAAQRMGQDESDAYDFANEWSGNLWSQVAEILTIISLSDGVEEYPSDCISALRFGNDFIYVGYDRNPERFVDDDRIVAELALNDGEGLRAWSEETEYIESVAESHGMTPDEWDRHLVGINTTADVGEEEPRARDNVNRCTLASRPEPIMMGLHKIDFSDDEAVDELSHGLAAAIVSKIRKMGYEPGTRTGGPATTITHIGGVAIPPEHSNSREDADAWLAKQARK